MARGDNETDDLIAVDAMVEGGGFEEAGGDEEMMGAEEGAGVSRVTRRGGDRSASPGGRSSTAKRSGSRAGGGTRRQRSESILCVRAKRRHHRDPDPGRVRADGPRSYVRARDGPQRTEVLRRHEQHQPDGASRAGPAVFDQLHGGAWDGASDHQGRLRLPGRFTAPRSAASLRACPGRVVRRTHAQPPACRLK